VTEYVHKLVDAFGCFGMIIKGSFLNTLINVIENNNVAVDEIIRVHIQHKYPCYAFIPFFMYVNDDYSDLWNKVRVLDKIKKHFSNITSKKQEPKGNKIVILSTLWNASRFIPQFVSSIKSQTYKNFKVIVVDDNSSDKSFELLKKLTNGDNRFTIIKNETQKFKTQNFYEIIHNRNLVNDNDIIIELDGDDSFYGNNVVDKVNNHFKDPNLWIAGYRWRDNRGQKSPFKHPPNPDNPRSQTWSYSAMRVFKAFLFKNIRQNDLMFEGHFIRAANDVAYGMPMLEMSGREHFKSFNDVTYLYNWHDKNTHSKTSSVRDTGLQKRTEKHIYSLPRYSKLKLQGVIGYNKNTVVPPKVTNIENSEKISKIKDMVKVIKPTETTIEVTPEVQKIVNIVPKITNNNNIKKIVSQVITSPKENIDKHSPVKIENKNSNRIIDKDKIQNFQNREVKSNPKVRFDNFIVKPQNKEEINKKREEFENILLFGPNGKKQINPISPKSIGISI
jgi:glycosyltransferase involved in cell wall biosynthesis